MSAFILKDLVFDQNADFADEEIYDPGGKIQNLAGWTAQMMVRINKTDTAPLLTLVSGSGITLGVTPANIDDTTGGKAAGMFGSKVGDAHIGPFA